MKKYSVYSNSHDVEICLEYEIFESRTDWSFEGSFKVFTHAKKLAIQVMATKVANFRHDYEEARYNKIKVGNIKKTDFNT